jgi:hypothetical protein
VTDFAFTRVSTKVEPARHPKLELSTQSLLSRPYDSAKRTHCRFHIGPVRPLAEQLEIVFLNCRRDNTTLVPIMIKSLDVLTERLVSNSSRDNSI